MCDGELSQTVTELVRARLRCSIGQRVNLWTVLITGSDCPFHLVSQVSTYSGRGDAFGLQGPRYLQYEPLVGERFGGDPEHGQAPARGAVPRPKLVRARARVLHLQQLVRQRTKERPRRLHGTLDAAPVQQAHA